MSNVQIRVIEDQRVEDKVIENPNAVQEYLSKQGINQNPFVSEEDQIKSYMNQRNNNQYRFTPKPNDVLTNREVKYVSVTDELNIQIEIRTDMPSNSGR